MRLFVIFLVVTVVTCCCMTAACSTRELAQVEPTQSPASPQAEPGPWEADVRALAGDPPLPGDPAIEAWPGLAEPSPTKPNAAIVYVCPMHPDVRSTQPGECPRCHMQLEARQ